MDTQIINLPPDGVDNEQPALPGGMLQSGEAVNGFHIERLLSSSGGEAEIYICSKDGKRHVLKYYYNKKPNPEVLDKLKSFSHKNINSILDSGNYKDRFFMILEYAEGGALDSKLPCGRFRYLPLGEDDAKQIVEEIIEGFDACHKTGIIHRDIKPGNLFYRNIETLPDGKQKGSGIMIGDFGISSIFEVDEGMSKHLTETGARTEGYAAPEVYSGVIGPEIDYYSLGITLWALLTGMEPFVNEKGLVLHTGQIMNDAIQGKTAEQLLSRSTGMSGFFQKLIKGLLTVRHEKRWKYDEVTRHLSGESVEIFCDEQRIIPLVEIGGESCSSYQEIAQAIIKNMEDGKQFIFSGKLSKYLIKFDQPLADRVIELAEQYSAEKREDEGTVFIANALCPGIAFPLGNGISISNPGEMLRVLETAPEEILPFLREEKKGLYAYLEVTGLGEQSKKIKEIVDAAKTDSRAVSRVTAVFQGNEIKPFKDGINDDYKLSKIEDLYALPDYLKERAMIFIERNYGILPAWIENVSGIDIDKWLGLLTEKKDRIEYWGAWEYFLLFMHGLESYDRIQKDGDYILHEKDGKKALFYKGELLYGVEKNDNSVKIVKQDGAEVFSGIYVINLGEGYKENGVSSMQFTGEDGKAAVFDGNQLCYFNLKTGEKEPRYELKESELERLVELGISIPVVLIAQSLKTNNNFTDMNKLIEKFWVKFWDDKKYWKTREILLLINEYNMDGLSRSYDYYLYAIGRTHFNNDEHTEAIPYFENAIKENKSGLSNSGQSYYLYYGQSICKGTFELYKAIDCFDKAMEITPGKSQPMMWKGYCFHRLGNYNEAIACLTLAIDNKKEKLNNDQKIYALETRAECYNALGMKDKAGKDNEEANKLKI